MIRVVHPGSRIRMLTFSHPGSRIQGSEKHPIPDPGSATLPSGIQTIKENLPFLLVETSSPSKIQIHGHKQIRIRNRIRNTNFFPSKLPFQHQKYIGFQLKSFTDNALRSSSLSRQKSKSTVIYRYPCATVYFSNARWRCDCMLRIRDVYPGSRILIFNHPGIPQIQNRQQKRGAKKKFVVIPFLQQRISQN